MQSSAVYAVTVLCRLFVQVNSFSCFSGFLRISLWTVGVNGSTLFHSLQFVRNSENQPEGEIRLNPLLLAESFCICRENNFAH